MTFNDDEFETFYNSACDNIGITAMIPQYRQDYKDCVKWIEIIFNVLKKEFKEGEEYNGKVILPKGIRSDSYTFYEKSFERLKKDVGKPPRPDEFATFFQMYYELVKLGLIPIGEKIRKYLSIHITNQTLSFIKYGDVINHDLNLSHQLIEYVIRDTDEIFLQTLSKSIFGQRDYRIGKNEFRLLYYYSCKLLKIECDINFGAPGVVPYEINEKLKSMKIFTPYADMTLANVPWMQGYSIPTRSQAFLIFAINTVSSRYQYNSNVFVDAIKIKHGFDRIDEFQKHIENNIGNEARDFLGLFRSNFDSYLCADILLSSLNGTSTVLPELRTFSSIGGFKYDLDNMDLEFILKYTTIHEKEVNEFLKESNCLGKIGEIIKKKFFFSEFRENLGGGLRDYESYFVYYEDFSPPSISSELLKKLRMTHVTGRNKNNGYLITGSKNNEESVKCLLTFDTWLSHIMHGIYFFDYCDLFNEWRPTK